MSHREEQIKARELKKKRREEHEQRAKEKKMKRLWIPHPEGTLNDGLGHYWYNGELLKPEGRILGHCQEGFLVLI
jgi:hypothetical protein